MLRGGAEAVSRNFMQSREIPKKRRGGKQRLDAVSEDSVACMPRGGAEALEGEKRSEITMKT